MKITIKAENDNGEIDIIFTNEGLNNLNYVDMIIGKEEYQVSVENLWLVAEVFDRLKKTK